MEKIIRYFLLDDQDRELAKVLFFKEEGFGYVGLIFEYDSGNHSSKLFMDGEDIEIVLTKLSQAIGINFANYREAKTML